MTGTNTPGPWQPGRTADCVVAAIPVCPASPAAPGVNVGGAVEYYGGHLIAESIAACNVPLISSAPTLLRRLERTQHTLLAAADSLEACATVCRVNHLLDTARAIATAAEHLRSTARLNARVIEKARGTTNHSESTSHDA